MTIEIGNNLAGVLLALAIGLSIALVVRRR